MKIYVEKLPKSCKYCPMNAYGIEKNYCSLYSINNIGQYIDCWNSKRHKKCPLVNIKIHDRELMAKVLEKVSKELENETGTYCEIRQCTSPHYQGDYVWFNYVKFRIFIAQILKEVE